MGGLKLGPEAQDKFEEAKREPDAQGFFGEERSEEKELECEMVRFEGKLFVLLQN